MLGYSRFFLCGVLTEMRSCSVPVKTMVKGGLSEGGHVQLDLLLNGVLL